MVYIEEFFFFFFKQLDGESENYKVALTTLNMNGEKEGKGSVNASKCKIGGGPLCNIMCSKINTLEALEAT